MIRRGTPAVSRVAEEALNFGRPFEEQSCSRGPGPGRAAVEGPRAALSRTIGLLLLSQPLLTVYQRPVVLTGPNSPVPPWVLAPPPEGFLNLGWLDPPRV